MDLIEAFKFNPLNGNPFKKVDDNLLVDTKTGFKFFLNPKPTANAIVLSGKDQILLCKRAKEPAKGTWDIPGGFVDQGETLEQAMVREIKEELNCQVDELKYFRSYPEQYLFENINYYLVNAMFVCTLKDIGNLHPADDISEARSFRVNSLPYDQIKFPSVVKFLKDYFS